jgi:hypothetical protein
MKRISELIPCDLRWIQPSTFRMLYELRANTELAATLGFRSAFGTFATGESGDGCWTFKRVGFFQTRVSIRVCGEADDLAIFRNNTWSGGGTLEIRDGKKFLADTNFWQSNLQFKTESGEPLVRFKTGGLIHLNATVEIEPQATRLEQLPLIVMLGWYLIVMMNSDSAASAVIIG